MGKEKLARSFLQAGLSIARSLNCMVKLLGGPGQQVQDFLSAGWKITLKPAKPLSSSPHPNATTNPLEVHCPPCKPWRSFKSSSCFRGAEPGAPSILARNIFLAVHCSTAWANPAAPVLMLSPDLTQAVSIPVMIRLQVQCKRECPFHNLCR